MASVRLSTKIALVIAFAVDVNAAEVVDIADLADDRASQLEQKIGERSVVFYAVDLETGRHFAYNPARADERHLPFSTFKIPNLVIALETGTASSLTHERIWDERRRPSAPHWPESWRQNQTLESAFKRSAAWYFQDIAVDVGGERYRKYLQDFGYGNANAPNGNDAFWLDGPLMVSPKEQALFLEQLIRGQLNVGGGTLEALREVSLLGDFSGFRLHGKTGSGPVIEEGQKFQTFEDFDGDFEGWLVGWVDRPQGTAVAYALHVRGSNYAAIDTFRGQMSAQFLRVLRALPNP